ncbi:MAG: ABC transporter permease [Alphaproteobacteria bacterium]|nr:MAG: ABC transporter permease [Alphaproteobacteria bacterium]
MPKSDIEVANDRRGEAPLSGFGFDLLRLIAKRLGLGLITLFVVSLIIFLAVNLLPGDFAQEILGQGATEEAVAAIRRELGLDQPMVQRYLSWLGGALQGDFGTSFGNKRPVAELLGQRFLNTLFLAGVAAAIAVPLAVGLGVLAALYRNSVFDRVANVATLTSISSPEFFLAYILILFLAVVNPVFDSLSNVSPDLDFWTRLQRTMLPALTLTLVVTAHMMRMTRAAIINLLASPYIEMARLKGVSPARVIVHHALPNALAPIINVIALNLAYLITGVVVVEVVFVYPGVGQLFVDSVKIRDIPIVQACCLIFAATYILLNLTADVLSILSNPRLRHPK